MVKPFVSGADRMCTTVTLTKQYIFEINMNRISVNAEVISKAIL